MQIDGLRKTLGLQKKSGSPAADTMMADNNDGPIVWQFVQVLRKLGQRNQFGSGYMNRIKFPGFANIKQEGRLFGLFEMVFEHRGCHFFHSSCAHAAKKFLFGVGSAHAES